MRIESQKGFNGFRIDRQISDAQPVSCEQYLFGYEGPVVDGQDIMDLNNARNHSINLATIPITEHSYSLQTGESRLPGFGSMARQHYPAQKRALGQNSSHPLYERN